MKEKTSETDYQTRIRTSLVELNAHLTTQLDILWEQTTIYERKYLGREIYRRERNHVSTHDFHQLPESEQLMWIEKSKPLFERFVRVHHEEFVINNALTEVSSQSELISCMQLLTEWIPTIPHFEKTKTPSWDYAISSKTTPKVAFEKTIVLASRENGTIDEDFLQEIAGQLREINSVEDTKSPFVSKFKDHMKWHAHREDDLEGNPNSIYQDTIFAMYDQLIKNGLVTTSSYFTELDAVHPLDVNPRFAVKLYEGLIGKGIIPEAEKYLPNTESADGYILLCTNIIRDILEKTATTSERAKSILERIKKEAVGSKQIIPYLEYINAGIEITNTLNDRGGVLTGDGDKRETLSEIQSGNLSGLSESLNRFMYVIYGKKPNTDDPTYQKHAFYTELVDLLADIGLTKMNQKRVITMGDIIARYPTASPEEIQKISEFLQRNKKQDGPVSIAEWLRERSEQGKNLPFFKRNKPGYGVIS